MSLEPKIFLDLLFMYSQTVSLTPLGLTFQISALFLWVFLLHAGFFPQSIEKQLANCCV